MRRGQLTPPCWANLASSGAARCLRGMKHEPESVDSATPDSDVHLMSTEQVNLCSTTLASENEPHTRPGQ